MQLSAKILCIYLAFFFPLWCGTGCSWQRCAFLEEAVPSPTIHLQSRKKKTARANQEVFWTTPQRRHLPVAQNWSAAAEGAYMRTPRKTNCASSTRRIHSPDDQTREKVPRYPLAVLLRPKAPYWEIQHQGFWKINLAKLLAWLRSNFARRSHFVVYFFLLYTGLSALVFVNAKKNLFSSMGSD